MHFLAGNPVGKGRFRGMIIRSRRPPTRMTLNELEAAKDTLAGDAKAPPTGSYDAPFLTRRNPFVMFSIEDYVVRLTLAAREHGAGGAPVTDSMVNRKRRPGNCNVGVTQCAASAASTGSAILATTYR